MGISILGGGLALRCFQRLSFPNLATQLLLLAEQLEHQRFVNPGPLVLGIDPHKYPTPMADRDRQLCYSLLTVQAKGRVISAFALNYSESAVIKKNLADGSAYRYAVRTISFRLSEFGV